VLTYRVALIPLIYVSVAQPAPVMKAYQAVRAEGERLIPARKCPDCVPFFEQVRYQHLPDVARSPGDENVSALHTALVTCLGASLDLSFDPSGMAGTHSYSS
jgi:hypothetical protein